MVSRVCYMAYAHRGSLVVTICHGSTFGSDFVVLVDFVVLLDRSDGHQSCRVSQSRFVRLAGESDFTSASWTNK
jgi:hypothetical protein